MKPNFESYNLRTKLHIEVLRDTYGKIDVDVLCDDDYKREVLLLDKDRIARTYALTLRKMAGNKTKKFPLLMSDQRGFGIGMAFKKWL